MKKTILTLVSALALSGAALAQQGVGKDTLTLGSIQD